MNGKILLFILLFPFCNFIIYPYHETDTIVAQSNPFSCCSHGNVNIAWHVFGDNIRNQELAIVNTIWWLTETPKTCFTLVYLKGIIGLFL